MKLEFPADHPFVVAQNEVALPKGAFIRALPFAFEESERFRLDALVLCSDIVATAYRQLVECSLRASALQFERPDEPDWHLNAAVFQHVWSIVDQIYSIRLLLKRLGREGKEIADFNLATENAYKFRNRMDHLNQNIDNISGSKSKNRSLFGSISYFVQGSAIGRFSTDAFAVLQQADPIRPGEALASLRVPSEIRMPIGNFTLGVDKQEFEIDNAILSLGPVMTSVNNKVENAVRKQVSAKSKEHNIPESDLMRHYGAGLRVMLPLKLK